MLVPLFRRTSRAHDRRSTSQKTVKKSLQKKNAKSTTKVAREREPLARKAASAVKVVQKHVSKKGKKKATKAS